MNRVFPFFALEEDEWTCKFSPLSEEIDNPEIELSVTLVYYDKKRPQKLVDFLENKFQLDINFSFLGNNFTKKNLTRSEKLKGISENMTMSDSKPEKGNIFVFFIF